MYHRSGMIRTVVLLLIGYFCVNVSSDSDCILDALDILRGTTAHDGIVQEPQTSTVQILRERNPSDGIVFEPQTTPSTFDVRNDDDTVQHSSPINIQAFKKLYLALKGKLQKLQIENDLLKNLYSTSSNLNAIHTIQTVCTCNVTERSTTPTNNGCSDLQTNILLEKVQDIQRLLSNITGNIRSSESNVECNYGRGAELEVG